MNEQPSPLDFLRAVYLNDSPPLSVRMRAVIEAAPYIHPKLSATATVGRDDSATMLERASNRSENARLIEHREDGR
jgi:hypothetical protein